MAPRTFHPTDYLGQKAVCDVLDIHARTLARRFAHFRLTGDDSEIPPFVMRGKHRKWRYDYLKLFAANKTALRGYMEHGYPDLDDDAFAPDTPQTLPPMDVVFKRISEWVEQERWRRAQDIITRKAFRRIGVMRFEDACALHDPKWNNPTDEEVGLFLKQIDLELRSVFHEIGLPWSAPFEEGDDQYFTHLGAKNLIGAALRKMFAEEKRWRAHAEFGDYAEDMPMKPPGSLL